MSPTAPFHHEPDFVTLRKFCFSSLHIHLKFELVSSSVLKFLLPVFTFLPDTEIGALHEVEICRSPCYLSEKAMATHSSTLAWKIPWTEEHGRLQSMGSLRVGHDWATSFSLFTSMHWRRKWQPAAVSCLENPRDRGASWAAVYGVTQSRTRLKQLSSSSMLSVIALLTLHLLLRSFLMISLPLLEVFIYL